MFDNYHLTRENASFDLDNKIVPNPLGERIDSSDPLSHPHRILHKYSKWRVNSLKGVIG